MVLHDERWGEPRSRGAVPTSTSGSSPPGTSSSIERWRGRIESALSQHDPRWTMRLLCVIDSLVPAGAERSLAALVPFYVERGVEVDVAYLHDRPGLQAELEGAG